MTMSNRKLFTLTITVLLVLVVALESGATMLVRMDLNALARSAEIIARVRCIHTNTRWESGAVWTFDDFDVLEVFKGSASQLLRVRLPGGRVEHTDVRIEGVPEFASGEETILFVERTSAGDYGITSWAQGTFRVRRQPSGDALLTQDTSHIAVFDPRTRQFTTTGARNLPLSEFREQLAEALVSTDGASPRR